ncbi:hypothetical protein HPP92_001599 [Vanilla planifolia]|uniref:Uncharacterized protein n=1 Tax=Vanilla planifolia TaxID=51239 RepID=A0A835SD65_VANPL|nr:hypothetical protein HPP92_001599 [Vanilla planifolia]
MRCFLFPTAKGNSKQNNLASRSEAPAKERKETSRSEGDRKGGTVPSYEVMGAECSSLASSPPPLPYGKLSSPSPTSFLYHCSLYSTPKFSSSIPNVETDYRKSISTLAARRMNPYSSLRILHWQSPESFETEEIYEEAVPSSFPTDLNLTPELVDNLLYDALVWSSLNGLFVGDRNVQRSGKIPVSGLVHAPFALLPTSFPKIYWKQACELAPIFNDLVDRVSLDGKFIQETLSRTKKVDAFTCRLLDIHSK